MLKSEEKAILLIYELLCATAFEPWHQLAIGMGRPGSPRDPEQYCKLVK